MKICRDCDYSVPIDGDPNGTQPDLAETVPTFCGKCQAIVLPDREGKVRVTVKAEGLPEAVFSRG